MLLRCGIRQRRLSLLVLRDLDRRAAVFGSVLNFLDKFDVILT